MRIELTWEEVQHVAHCAVVQYVRTQKRGAISDGGDSNWQTEIIGFLGEFAFAKAYGLLWNPAGEPGDPDFEPAGFPIDVKTTPHERGRLMVKPQHLHDGWSYVLVTGGRKTTNGDPLIFNIRGAMGDKEVGSYPITDPVKKGPAHWVPQSDLRPVEQVLSILAMAH